MANFLKKYKYWLLIALIFLATRIIVFASFWEASQARGGWQNFYGFAQPAHSVLLKLFHDYCDWHPPLFYFFSSSFLSLGSQWFLYLAQMALSFISLILTYKIARLFFSEKIAFFSCLLIALEPFWAWHNWLFSSENLSTPLLLAAFYFWFRFLKLESAAKNIVLAGIFFGLAALARPNYLFLPVLLMFLTGLLFLFRKQFSVFANFNSSKLAKYLVFFLAVFVAMIMPWMIRNKVIYGRFVLANILSTNIYFYNVPPLLAIRDGISYEEGYRAVYAQAKKDLGPNVGDQGDCQLFSKEEFNRHLDYYETQSKKIIFGNFGTYLKIHLLRTIPFFFQPGYMDMIQAWGGDFKKPDLTSLMLMGRWQEIFDFFSSKASAIYFLGVVLWGLLSLGVFLSLIYSYFKDRKKFVFFFFGTAVILYNAFLISPFVLARYRLSIYIFFFAPAVYIAQRISKNIFAGMKKEWHKKIYEKVF